VKIPYGKQSITPEDIEAVVKTLQSDFLTQGPHVNQFEEAFAATVGSKFAVAFNNATAALHLAYKVLNKGNGKKVLTTPITFAASSNCVLFENGQVEFVDIDPISFNIDLHALEEKIINNPTDYQGMVIVDFAGLPLDTEKFKVLAAKYNLWIIEDACHAIGGYFKNSQGEKIRTGSSIYSDLSIFSFHPVKHIATGEGGMVTTNDEITYKRLLKLRSHGIEREEKNFSELSHGGWYHEMQELGYNYRMSDINATLGNSQLKRIESNVQRRNEVAQKYKMAFKSLPVKMQVYDEDKIYNAYHLFVIETDKRKELYDFLKSKEIYTQVHYLPVYWHPYYQSLGFKKGLCPKAESYYSRCLSLPMYHSLTEIEQDYVIQSVREFFNQNL
jgi:UDP-4-amino-4,6-dideoxy-N-acetyl-beta-L-altrosamine transaminase